jgi:hypothetical protein
MSSKTPLRIDRRYGRVPWVKASTILQRAKVHAWIAAFQQQPVTHHNRLRLPAKVRKSKKLPLFWVA